MTSILPVLGLKRVLNVVVVALPSADVDFVIVPFTMSPVDIPVPLLLYTEKLAM